MQFERIATEASKLARYSKKPTISSREIQTAVRCVLRAAELLQCWLECWRTSLCLCIRAPVWPSVSSVHTHFTTGAPDPAW
jgi:hypothetical protein